MRCPIVQRLGNDAWIQLVQLVSHTLFVEDKEHGRTEHGQKNLSPFRSVARKEPGHHFHLLTYTLQVHRLLIPQKRGLRVDLFLVLG